MRRQRVQAALARRSGTLAIPPAYTSQKCACCGRIQQRKTASHKSQFECLECGYTANADINAAHVTF